MLPKHYCHDSENNGYTSDAKWIEGQLDKLPIQMQKEVCDKYSDIYLKLSNEDPQKCQFRANCWLRKIVDRHGIKLQEGYF